MRRYLRLLAVQLRASMQLSMQYRLDFLVQGLTALFWTGTTFVPLFVVFGRREGVAGWSFAESLLVLGFFLLVKSVLEGAVNPSLIAVVEHIRKGTLDFVLLKPADAQFLVSTAKFEPSSAAGLLGAAGVLAWALARLDRAPSAGGVALAAVLLATGLVVLYSLWILVISAAFRLVRVDNLAHLFTSIFDAARWPASVFRGFFHILFTWIIPLALMTTYPAEALLGRLGPPAAAIAIGLAVAFAVAARAVWLGSIRHYTSASS